MIARDRFSAPAGLAAALIAASGAVAALALPAAPRLSVCDTSGSEPVGFAAPASPLIVPVTQVRLRFDLPLATQPGTGAESPSNFRVVAAGPDGVIATTACGAQSAGDDVGV